MRLSLLRAPKAPDANADMGHHSFKYALMPHNGNLNDAGVIQRGYDFNVPLRTVPSVKTEGSMFKVDKTNVIIEAVKKAEKSNDIIVRLWEAFGGRGQVTLSSPLDVKKVVTVNMIENETSDSKSLTWTKEGCVLSFKPFEIITLRLSM